MELLQSFIANRCCPFPAGVCDHSECCADDWRWFVCQSGGEIMQQVSMSLTDPECFKIQGIIEQEWTNPSQFFFVFVWLICWLVGLFVGWLFADFFLPVVDSIIVVFFFTMFVSWCLFSFWVGLFVGLQLLYFCRWCFHCLMWVVLILFALLCAGKLEVGSACLFSSQSKSLLGQLADDPLEVGNKEWELHKEVWPEELLAEVLSCSVYFLAPANIIEQQKISPRVGKLVDKEETLTKSYMKVAAWIGGRFISQCLIPKKQD